MKTKSIIFIALLFANLSFGVTIQLRKGGTVEGEIVGKGREDFVLKTEKGEKTFKWRQVKSSCIKKVFPELYQKLKAEAIERKKKKSKDKFDYKKETADSPDFARIGIEVLKTEKSGSFEKESDEKYMKTYSKLNQGVLNVKLNWLKKEKNYKLKTVFTHYLKTKNLGETDSSKIKPSDMKTEKIEQITNKTGFETQYLTSPYYEYKKNIKPGISTKGKRKIYYGFQSGGWDISVYLNDKLIYKEEKGKDPDYFIVNKL